MKKWILLVETLLNERPVSALWLQRITADTPENRKYLADIEKFTKQIDWEEQRDYEIPLDAQVCPSVDDKNEWNNYWNAKELEWDEIKRVHDERTRVEAQKRADAYRAQVDGIRLAAKDAMDDKIEQDREVVSKLAKQAIKSQQQQSQRIKKQAMRLVKEN